MIGYCWSGVYGRGGTFEFRVTDKFATLRFCGVLLYLHSFRLSLNLLWFDSALLCVFGCDWCYALWWVVIMLEIGAVDDCVSLLFQLGFVVNTWFGWVL